jgi:hypothetical protein
VRVPRDPAARQQYINLLNERSAVIATAIALLANSTDRRDQWVRDQLRQRRKWHSTNTNLGIIAARLEDDNHHGRTETCLSSGKGIIRLDTLTRVDVIALQQLHGGRATLEEWHDLLVTLVHELVHDFDAPNLPWPGESFTHPPVSELGVGDGPEEYDRVANNTANRVTGHFDDAGRFIPNNGPWRRN